MRYALITGASRGLGRAIAIKLSSMGWAVIINYQSNDAAALETQKTIEEAGGKAELLKFDVSDPKDIEEKLDLWISEHPEDNIAALVNNAGIRKDNLLVFMQDQEWNSVINTSLNGFFYITRKVAKDMMFRRYGRIVNVASLSGIKGLPGQTNYSAAKAAIIGATKALAQELAARKITVNAVAPGFFETDMTKDLDQDELKKLIPMRRFGKAEELASLVGFLISDESSYITGEVISINGGLYT